MWDTRLRLITFSGLMAHAHLLAHLLLTMIIALTRICPVAAAHPQDEPGCHANDIIAEVPLP